MDRVAQGAAAERRRLKVEVRGLVQGVGFRPHVWRLARELGLDGFVRNDTQGVAIEVEGPDGALTAFVARLRAEAPPRSRIESLDTAWAATGGVSGFAIVDSDVTGAPTVPVLPDLATCPECLAEVNDSAARRHRYPFTNCTHCGPRFTIVRRLPYDRPGTTMAGFTLCPDCRREYRDPGDRRFHAQPIACPACGPALALLGRGGAPMGRGDQALRLAADAIKGGFVVAVKGLGGFHLLADAGNSEAVIRLRQRKPRRDKPFALMVRDLDEAARLCVLPQGAAAALASPEAPIILMPRRAGAPVAAEVAPGNPYLGLMLPPTPLHHLLIRAAGRPVVATSGNLSEEPICTDEKTAILRLGGIADLFLVHDRPIARQVDDSVAVVLRGEVRLLRRARGFAPAPVRLRRQVPAILAVGGQLKNTVALAVGERVHLSQHIGDLETPEAEAAFERVIEDFLRLYGAVPAAIAHDLHPDYVSTRWAKGGAADRAAAGRLAGVPRIAVQHHHAHLAACLAENGVEDDVLGVAWDGTGLGADGTIWGGEFLLGSAAGFRRVAHLKAFRLMGGDAAVREPRRAALAALLETFGEACLAWHDLAPIRAFEPSERMLLATMRARAFNAPVTTSAGRLFDAVAALAGLGLRVSFEGQAAMALEFAADAAETAAYPMPILEEGGAATALVLDWRPALVAIVEDVRRGTPAGAISARFHNALADAIASVARRVGCARVALTGGCFQNRRLVEMAAARLESAGFEVLLHRQVPPNDGGLALGQVAVAAAVIEAGQAARVSDTDAAPASDGLLVVAGSAPGTDIGRGGH